MPHVPNPYRSDLIARHKNSRVIGRRTLKVNFFCWVLALPVAIIGFLELKKSTDRRRLEDLKAIQRAARKES